MFDNEDSTNIKKFFDENIKYLEDIVSERCKLVYNVCAINFYRHALRRHNQILDIYAWCVYFKDGCKKYKFKIIWTDDPIKVLVFATKTDITHPIKHKKHQLRGVRRIIAKKEIRHMKPSKWRDIKLCGRSKRLKRLGNNQELVSKYAGRKLKMEEMRSLDRGADNFIDLYKDKNWKLFIRSVKSRKNIC